MGGCCAVEKKRTAKRTSSASAVPATTKRGETKHGQWTKGKNKTYFTARSEQTPNRENGSPNENQKAKQSKGLWCVDCGPSNGHQIVKSFVRCESTLTTGIYTKPASVRDFRMMISLTALKTAAMLFVSVAHVTCV